MRPISVSERNNQQENRFLILNFWPKFATHSKQITYTSSSYYKNWWHYKSKSIYFSSMPKETERRQGTNGAVGTGKSSGLCCSLGQRKIHEEGSQHRIFHIYPGSETICLGLGLFLFFKYSTLYFLRKMLKNTYKKILKIIKFSYWGEVLGFVFREWQNYVWQSVIYI